MQAHGLPSFLLLTRPLPNSQQTLWPAVREAGQQLVAQRRRLLRVLEGAELNCFEALLHLAPKDEAVQVYTLYRTDMLQLRWQLQPVTCGRALTIAAALQPSNVARAPAL
jgi:hypothetical protein